MYFPLFFKIDNYPCLITGGGDVAFRKVTQLLKFEANITVISPEVVSRLEKLAETGRIVWKKREYKSPEAAEYNLVIAATDDYKVNEQTFKDAKKNGVPVNVVDIPELCTVIFPSIIKRGNITYTIGSDGRSPYLTRALREELEGLIPENLEELSELAADFREFVLKNTADKIAREKMFKKFMIEKHNLTDNYKKNNPPVELWNTWLEKTDE